MERTYELFVDVVQPGVLNTVSWAGEEEIVNAVEGLPNTGERRWTGVQKRFRLRRIEIDSSCENDFEVFDTFVGQHMLYMLTDREKGIPASAFRNAKFDEVIQPRLSITMTVINVSKVPLPFRVKFIGEDVELSQELPPPII